MAGLFMKSNRIHILVLIFSCVLVFLYGCRKKPADNSITFAVGGTPSELEFWNVLIKQFEQDSGITVDILRQPTDTDLRRQGLMTSLKSRKSKPDVFLLDVAWVGQFASSGWLAELDSGMEAAQIDRQGFFKKVMDQVDTYKGNLVALPVYVDGGLLYYRSDLLAGEGISQPPQTWQQLLEHSLAIQEKLRRDNPDFYGFAFMGAQYEGLICSWLEFAVSAGGGIELENGQVQLNTPENRKATAFMRDLIHEYEICPPNTYTDMKEEQVRSRFEVGNALFARNWPYAWVLFHSDDSPVQDRFGIAALPHFTGGKSVSTLGGWHVGINTYSERKTDAFKLVSFITSYETQKKLVENLGWNPGRVDLYDDPELMKTMPHLPRLREIFMHLHARPNVPYYTLVSEVLQRRLNAVLSGRMAVEEALERAENECSDIVERYAGTD